MALGVVGGVTGLNCLLDHWIGYQALALIYLLAVVVLAMYVGRGATFLAATVTALSWDVFFTEPRHSFRIVNAADGMMFVTYFLISLAMAHLAARLRAQQAAERQREPRATAPHM